MYNGFERANLGSGSMCLDGFLNIDWPPGHLDGIKPDRKSDNVVYRTPDLYMDITSLNKIPNGSFSYIRACHTLEHFCISRTRLILKEWTRILSIGGTIDIVVPDFDIIIERYLDKTGRYDQWWEETKNDKGLWYDTPEKKPLMSKEHAMFELMYLNGHHKAFFNFTFLKQLLGEHNIKNIHKYENNIMDTALCNYSLCVKGDK
ncbi:MAG: hypothetical protein Q7R95_09980 [bacterium]|nr:hypothetical protein [bacterium]